MKKVYMPGSGDHFVVPSRFAKEPKDAKFIMSTIEKYLTNKRLHPLVKPFFRIGDYMHGIPGCFDLVPVREFYEIKKGFWYPGLFNEPRDETPVPCKYCKIQMITKNSRPDETGDAIFGPVKFDTRLHLMVLVSGADSMLTPLIAEESEID